MRQVGVDIGGGVGRGWYVYGGGHGTEDVRGVGVGAGRVWLMVRDHAGVCSVAGDVD